MNEVSGTASLALRSGPDKSAVATGITLKEHKQRRTRLMSMMSPGSIAIIPGAAPKRRNRDVQYLFRQDSDFYYLSGFAEAEALLVLIPGREHGEEILFCAERDALAERWDGERMGPERATQMLGIDDAFPFSDLEDILPGLLEGTERIYITLGEHPEFDQKLLGWVATIRQREAGGAQPPGEFVELKHLLHELRLYKSPAELKLMREAATITCDAHLRAMSACEPGVTEAQLEAELTYEFMRRGARSPAYPCIVGAGANACVLHYVENKCSIVSGDLVLIDAGCEYQHYAADVTRTFPANGRFTKAQREIYDLVLRANEAAIAQCRPGNTFNAPHDAAVATMAAGLIELGFLLGDYEEIMEQEAYKDFCPHRTSHWLGMDVHDVGDYRFDEAWREFEPGMVLTIEPGIYIPINETTNHVPKRYRGIGVRIEDDVLITKNGHEVLTTGVPKSIDAIEAFMADGVLPDRKGV